MHDQSWYDEVDLTRPSPARVYDYFLGGAHNFAVDREMAARLAAVMPDIGDIMRANRAFLRRAVAHLVGVGIRQFLDLGSGVPTVGNVHEIAQQHAPDARVVYVDVDPVAVAHSSSILADNPNADVIREDLRDADAVLAHPTVHKLLDLTAPVAVLLVGVLHQLPGRQPGEALARYRRELAPGSYLVLSQATQDGHREETAAFQETHNRGYGPREDMTLRTRAEVLELLTGFDLVEPGLVYLPLWRPEGPVDGDPQRQSTYGAVGRLGPAR